jgi:hypothetical protein
MALRLERGGENEGKLVRRNTRLEENHDFEISATSTHKLEPKTQKVLPVLGAPLTTPVPLHQDCPPGQ